MRRATARLVPLAVLLALAACGTHPRPRTGLGSAGGPASASPSAPGGLAGTSTPPSLPGGSPSASNGPGSDGSGSGSGGGGTGGSGATPSVHVSVTTSSSEVFEPFHCPVAEPVDGLVTVDRGPVTIAYEWVRGNGTHASGTLRFTGTGPQSSSVRDMVPIKAAIVTTVTDELVLPGRSYNRSQAKRTFIQECEPSATVPTTTGLITGTCPRTVTATSTLDLPVVPIRVELLWYGALAGPNSAPLADYHVSYPAGSTLHPTVTYDAPVTGTGIDLSLRIIGPGQFIDAPFRSKPLALFCIL